MCLRVLLDLLWIFLEALFVVTVSCEQTFLTYKHLRTHLTCCVFFWGCVCVCLRASFIFVCVFVCWNVNHTDAFV